MTLHADAMPTATADLAGRDGAIANAIADRGYAELGEIAHYSMTFGTAKKPCSASGALARTASRIPPSVTLSSWS